MSGLGSFNSGDSVTHCTRYGSRNAQRLREQRPLVLFSSFRSRVVTASGFCVPSTGIGCSTRLRRYSPQDANVLYTQRPTCRKAVDFYAEL